MLVVKKNINVLLHKFIEKSGVSKFVTKAIKTALKKEKIKLKAAFKESENDPNLKEIMDDWSALDGEGWDS